MNRIYQGRVTKVQVPAPAAAEETVGRKKAKKDAKPEWLDLPDGEAALWRHHELFQDQRLDWLSLILAPRMSAAMFANDHPYRHYEGQAFLPEAESIMTIRNLFHPSVSH